MRIKNVFFSWDWELSLGITRIARNHRVAWLFFIGFLTISTMRNVKRDVADTTFCIPPMRKDKGKLWTFIK